VSAGSRGADDGLHKLAIVRFFTPPFVGVMNRRLFTPDWSDPALSPKAWGGVRLPAVCARSSTPIHTDSMIGPTGRSYSLPHDAAAHPGPPTAHM